MLRVELGMPSTKGLGAEAIELLRPALREFVQEAATSLRDNIVRKVSGTGRGKLYTRDGRTHRASAPGEAPARDVGSSGSAQFGAYANSWDTDTKEGPTYIEGRVGSTMFRAGVALGAMLEWGTRYIKPRPHVGPAVAQWKRELDRKISGR